MKFIKILIIIFISFSGLISIFFNWQDLYNTQDIYLLITAAASLGFLTSAAIARKGSCLFSNIHGDDKLAAKFLFFVGTICSSISASCVLNINYAKNITTSSYEISDKRHQEKAGKAPESWYISIDRHGKTIELKVSNKDFKRHSVGDKLPVKEINGFFNWFVLLPDS